MTIAAVIDWCGGWRLVLTWLVAVVLIAGSQFSLAQGQEGTNYHYVTNTRPPDAFLSLRTQPSTSAGQRIAIMQNGTAVEVLRKQSNGWWFVRVVHSGQEGWALSGEGRKTWIECCVATASAVNGPKFRGFKTPSGNIHCMLDDFEPTADHPINLRCDIRNIETRPLRPRSCDLDWGHAFAIVADADRGEMWCVGDTTYDDNHPVLAYGQVWQAKGFTCRSEQSGLTCFNYRQHGFALSRAVQKLF